MSSEFISGSSLYSERIDNDRELIIDPDNVFWALSRDGDIESPSEKRALSLYRRFKGRLDKLIQELRFKTSLNAIYIDAVDSCNAVMPAALIVISL